MQISDIPQPLPANSPRIRRRRYEAWVGEAAAPGRYRMIDEGRFATIEDARTWVQSTYPDAQIVNYTYLSETDGWRTHSVEAR